MSGSHGLPVTANELALALSAKGPDELVRLTNAVVVAVASALPGGCAPIVSELNNLPDGGRDLIVESPCNRLFLRQGTNLFQVKWKDVTRTDAKTAWKDLSRAIDKEIRKLPDTLGSCAHELPSNYVLVTNLPLRLTEQETWQESRETRFPDMRFQILPADRLRSLLINLPHVTWAFFDRGRYSMLADAERGLRKVHESFALTYPERFISREEDLARLRAWLHDADRPLLVLRGHRGIGLTRLVVEALREHAGRTAWTQQHLPGRADLGTLASAGAVLVVDELAHLSKADCDLLLTLEGAKTLLVAPDAELPHLPEQSIVQVQPMQRSDLDAMLRSSGIHLHPVHRMWALDNSDGLPGLALILASAVHAQKELSDIKKLLLSRFLTNVNEDDRTLLEVIAFFGPVGAAHDRLQELLELLELLHCRTQQQAATISRLVDRGLLERCGRFVRVRPGLLERALAECWLENNPQPDPLLLADERWIRPFMRGLERSGGSETACTYARNILSRWFPDYGSLAGSSIAIKPLASVAPREWTRHFLRLIKALSPEEISSIETSWYEAEKDCEDFDFSPRDRPNARRELVWAAEEIVSGVVPTAQPGDAITALAILAQPAEIETEHSIANNATGVFAEAFKPGHPQVIASLPARAELLESLAHSCLSRPVSHALAEVWDSVILTDYRGHRSRSLRVPLAQYPDRDRILAYLVRLAAVTERLTTTCITQPKVGEAVAKAVTGLSSLEMWGEAVRIAEGAVGVIEDARQRPAWCIDLGSALETAAEQAIPKKSQSTDVQRHLERLLELRQRLESGSYRERLQRHKLWEAETLDWDSDEIQQQTLDILGEPPDSPRRNWLVQRIMRDADFDTACKLLGAEDVRGTLDSDIDLPSNKRRMWDHWLKRR